LARTYPPAAEALTKRRADLAAVIAKDPEHVESRVLDVYLELVRQSQAFREANELLKGITGRDPHATNTRRRLLDVILEWLQSQKAYADIGVNRDVLESELASNREFAEFHASRRRALLIALYQTLLSTGHNEDAVSVASEFLTLGEPRQAMRDLLDVANGVGATVETARLKAMLDAYTQCDEAPNRPASKHHP
jgi:hypothetical protein